MRRFYYDPSSGVCRPFTYTGCKGNANNFVSENKCIKACVPDTNMAKALEPKALFLGDACQMPKQIGRCRASMPKYYYDPNLKVCRLFFYGGCGGNGNR